MKFTPSAIDGVWFVDLDRRGDDRGFFARVFDVDEFAQHGLVTSFPQINTSFSAEAGTLRGLHLQVAPHGEAKFLKCIRGAVFDVAVDLRQGSPTLGRWVGAELNANNRRMIYVPEGCAHGFMTLTADTEVLYCVSTPYNAAAERVLAWDDPTVAIDWPRTPAVLSEKDQKGAPLAALAGRIGY